MSANGLKNLIFLKIGVGNKTLKSHIKTIRNKGIIQIKMPPMRGTFVSRSLCISANIGVGWPSGATVLTSFRQSLYLYKKCVNNGVKAMPTKNDTAANPKIFRIFNIILNLYYQIQPLDKEL